MSKCQLFGVTRLQREIKQLILAGYEPVTKVTNNNDECTEKDLTDVRKVEVLVTGPKQSAYEGYKFKLAIDLGELFPFKPINIIFLTKIKHINIREKVGLISPQFVILFDPTESSLCDMLDSIVSLLAQPNPSFPVNLDLLKLYHSNPLSYYHHISDYCQQFAFPINK